MEISSGKLVPVCTILEKFPLDFAVEISQLDRDLIVNCIRVYKHLSTADEAFNFIEPREIFLIAEFFARYGEQIRQVQLFN